MSQLVTSAVDLLSRIVIPRLLPFRTANVLEYVRHNSSDDRAREVFKPSKDAESLLVRIKKTLGSYGFEFFCGLRHNRGRFRFFWPTC